MFVRRTQLGLGLVVLTCLFVACASFANAAQPRVEKKFTPGTTPQRARQGTVFVAKRSEQRVPTPTTDETPVVFRQQTLERKTITANLVGAASGSVSNTTVQVPVGFGVSNVRGLVLEAAGAQLPAFIRSRQTSLTGVTLWGIPTDSVHIVFTPGREEKAETSARLELEFDSAAAINDAGKQIIGLPDGVEGSIELSGQEGGLAVARFTLPPQMRHDDPVVQEIIEKTLEDYEAY